MMESSRGGGGGVLRLCHLSFNDIVYCFFARGLGPELRGHPVHSPGYARGMSRNL